MMKTMTKPWKRDYEEQEEYSCSDESAMTKKRMKWKPIDG
jgi:hypothetical protein